MSAAAEGTHDIALKLDIKSSVWPDSGAYVVGLQGNEGMSVLFEFQVEVYLTTEIARADMADLLGHKAVITFTDSSSVQGANLVRFRNGIVGDASYGGSFVDDGSDTTIYTYSVSVVPAAYRHLLRSNCRVFVNHSLANVFNSICTSGNLLSTSEYSLKLSPELQNLGWCGGLRNESPEMGFRVQYRETT